MTENGQRIIKAVRTGLPKAKKTIFWLLKLIIPISLGVQLLKYIGLLSLISSWLNPAFQAVGLPGEASIAFVCSIFLPLYAPVAIMGTLSLTVREMTILTMMCLISHNTLVETAVQKKTGSSFWFIWCLRFSMSFVAAFIWNFMLPDTLGVTTVATTTQPVLETFPVLMQSWAIDTVRLSLKICLIVTGLMILQRLLEEFRVMDWLSKVFAPFMRVMGLSKDCSFLWFVANIIGLTYGSAILIEQIDDGKLAKADARMLNNHLAISHSLLEDTLVPATALGVPIVWITIPRLLLAIAVVWIIRLFQHLKGSKTVKK